MRPCHILPMIHLSRRSRGSQPNCASVAIREYLCCSTTPLPRGRRGQATYKPFIPGIDCLMPPREEAVELLSVPPLDCFRTAIWASTGYRAVRAARARQPVWAFGARSLGHPSGDPLRVAGESRPAAAGPVKSGDSFVLLGQLHFHSM